MMPAFTLLTFLEICRDVSALLFLWSWQATLILALTFFIARFNRSRTAEFRHKIWFTALVSIAILPFWSFVSQYFPASQSIEALPQVGEFPATLLSLAANINNAAEQTNMSWFDQLEVFACGVWIIGISGYLIQFLASHQKMHRIVRRSELLTINFYESIRVDSFSPLPANINLRSSSEISNPTLTGFFRPVILFPANIEEWTSEIERRAIIQHEVAHLERYDHFTQILQTIIKAVFFFHPFVRYTLNQLNFERELACDEKVIGSGINANEYTEVILKVAEHDIKRRESWQLTFTPKQQLHRRIYKIMKNNNQSLPKFWRFLVLAKTAVLLALVVWFATPNQTAAQGSPVSRQASRVSGADDQTSENFKRLYESMKDALLKGDKASFENFFADDYAAISVGGTTLNKQQVIDSHIQKPSADIKLENVEFNDFQVKTYGDTVIVTYAAEMSGLYKGAKFSHRAHITDVWKKNGDKWQSVASHASNVS